MRRNFCATKNVGIFLRHVKQAYFMRAKSAAANMITNHHDLKVVVLLNIIRMSA